MPAPLITLPCTARDLEIALHAYCDHHGAWDFEITAEELDMDNHVWGLSIYPAPHPDSEH